MRIIRLVRCNKFSNPTYTCRREKTFQMEDLTKQIATNKRRYIYIAAIAAVAFRPPSR